MSLYSTIIYLTGGGLAAKHVGGVLKMKTRVRPHDETRLEVFLGERGPIGFPPEGCPSVC